MEVNLKSIIFNKYLATGLFLILYIILAYEKLAFYVRFDFNFILLLIVLPFVTRQNSKITSIRYGIIAIVLLLLYPFLKLSSIYFFAFVCSILFLYESQFGKLTSIPLFLVIIVSPVAIFLSEIIGFEIRLHLTQIAAKVLSFIDDGYTSIGNIIIHGGNEYHVDNECMGLKMVLLSLFLTLIFISYQQRKRNIEYNIFIISISLLSAYLLVIISNLCRIILITLFNSPPESFSHELIGIICFVVYLVIPIWFVIKYLPSRKLEAVSDKTVKSISKSSYYIIAFLLTSLFLVYHFTSLGTKDNQKINLYSINVGSDNYSESIEEHGVLKLVNNDLLIYIKPAQQFYSADHSPIICWRGSGYKVQQEQIINIGSNDIYFSELNQDGETLYATWWYDSGSDKTISQFRWRIQNLLSGEEYRLINVISYKKDILFDETNKLLSKNIFIDK